MAERPVFAPNLTGTRLVQTWDISFTWFAGMSVKQAQKSIDALHDAAKLRMKVDKVLEISSKSKDPMGVRLSAFNLMINTKKYNQTFSVECAYQSAKVFEHGGPYKDLREKTSREAKVDLRLKESGKLVKFQLFEVDWALEPKTAFYDWIYINALHSEPELANYVLQHRAFSDIAFNPEKSLNCQAYSAALYVALHERGLLTREVLRGKESYLEALRGICGPEGATGESNKPSIEQDQPDMFDSAHASFESDEPTNPADSVETIEFMDSKRIIELEIPDRAEIPHGHGLSFKRGVVAGLMEVSDTDDKPQPTGHTHSYRRGKQLGKQLLAEVTKLVKD